MNNSITRERLAKIKSWRETYGTGSNVMLPAEEAEELACIALAAMDSEPDCKERKLFCSTDTARMRKVISASAGSEATPLYRHAQPVPVVPDELNTRTANDVMNEHLSWKDYGDAEVFCIAWNACRAAMLQAGTLTNEGTKQAWTGIPDIDNAINMLDRIDTLESCDDDRIEAVKTVLRGLAGNSPVIPDGSADMLRRWLAFGRGMQNAGSQLPHNLIAETESMLAAAPQEDINALIPLVSRDEQEVK